MNFVYREAQWSRETLRFEGNKLHSVFKPATHLAILYADRRDQRKSPGVPGAAIAIFADRRDQIRRHAPSVPVPAIFYVHRCELAVKSINQVGRFYHMTMLKCHIAVIGEKNRQLCQHQSVAIKFAAIGI